MATPLLYEKEVYQSIGYVQYNGVRFPPFCDVRVETEPVYDKANRSVEALRIRVDVTGFVTPDMFAVAGNPEPVLRPVSNQPGQPPREPVSANESTTTDKDMTLLSRRLCIPGKRLEIDNRGVGQKIVISGVRQTGIVPDHQYDIRNGPKPGPLKITPYSPYNVKIEWSCEAMVSPCLGNKNPLIQDPLSPTGSANLNNILSFNYTTNVTVSSNLTAVRRIRGDIRVAKPFDDALPLTGLARSNEVSDTWDTILRRYLTQTLFPKGNQFTRETDFTLSEDRTLISFQITDTEIATDNPYPVGLSEIEATNTIESGLGSGGFKVWQGTLAVSGEVYVGYPKNLLWQIYRQLENAMLRHEYKAERDQLIRSVITRIDYGKPAEKLNDTASRFLQQLAKPPTYIRTKLKFTDSIFSRKGSIEGSYQLTADLSYVLMASGVFLPLPNWLYGLTGISSRDIPWGVWSADQRNNAGSGKGYGLALDMSPGGSAWDVCLPTAFLPSTPSPVPIPYNGFGQTEFGSIDSSTNSGYSGYMAYSNKKEVYADNNSTQYAYMESQEAFRPRTFQDPDSVGTAASRMASIDGVGISSGSGSSSGSGNNSIYTIIDPTTEQPRVVSASRRTGYPTYRLVIRGQAVRWGDDPLVPEVFGFGQRTLVSDKTNAGGQTQNGALLVLGTPIKIGTDRVVRTSLGSGVNIETGQEGTINHVSWVKQYLLSHNPTDGTILTDGLSLGESYT
jgi:hypothetical protein